MKLAFKVGEGGNNEEEGVREIEDLADEESADEEGDMETMEEEKKEGKKEDTEEAATKPGFLRRARNKYTSSRRTVGGMIGTRMTCSEACSLSIVQPLNNSGFQFRLYFQLSYNDVCVLGLAKGGRGFIRVASKPASSSHHHCWQVNPYIPITFAQQTLSILFLSLFITLSMLFQNLCWISSFFFISISHHHFWQAPCHQEE